MGVVITDGMRFESFFLDQLRIVKAIDVQKDLLTRARLNFEAISVADSVGFFENGIPTEFRKPPIPKWCLVATGIAVETTIALIESLYTNSSLDTNRRQHWHTLAQSQSFVDFAPGIFREMTRVQKKWTAEKSLACLDRSREAVSGTNIPTPGTETAWEEHCRKNPFDPVSLVGQNTFQSGSARRLAQELLIAAELHKEGIIDPDQLRSIFDASYHGLTAHRGVTDLDVFTAEIVSNGLKLDTPQKAKITMSLASARVGLVDPESPWNELCKGPDAPPMCRYISAFPVAARFTTELIHLDIWNEDEALTAWNQMAQRLDLMLDIERPLKETGRTYAESVDTYVTT